jgi:hypothetical protein
LVTDGPDTGLPESLRPTLLGAIELLEAAAVELSVVVVVVVVVLVEEPPPLQPARATAESAATARIRMDIGLIPRPVSPVGGQRTVKICDKSSKLTKAPR